MALNSVDLKKQRRSLKKNCSKQAEVSVPLGKSIRVWLGFGQLFDKIVNFFDVVVTW